MSYLLDTCILSKGRKHNSDSEKLKRWLDQHPETSYFISALSIGEIQAGISKLSQEEHRKKRVFEDWLLGDLIPRFEHRILGIDVHTCSLWGQLRGEAQKRGRSLPAIDALIAASAIQHQLILVTENTKDFLATGARLLNPLVELILHLD
ncbi:MAG: type II toxin-antitoxin system VapC family toxin [Chlamydiota bacterium]